MDWRNWSEKRLQHKLFPVKFSKILKMSFLKNICERLLLGYNQLKPNDTNLKTICFKHYGVFSLLLPKP